jgi:hemolysin D
LAKAETRTGQQTLMAPIDGVVQQLAVHTVGGVVTPAQQLMVIAPREGDLEVEAWIENKDIGFVNSEQDAEVKIEAFPFTRYGVIDGRVLTLSKDAVPIEKVGLVYTARVHLDKSTIRVENDKEVYLSPGMNVTVEIKTGQRRLIEYFLSPLLQAGRESIRER